MLLPSVEADCILTVIENGVETQMQILPWPPTPVDNKVIKGKYETLKWICLRCHCDNGEVECNGDKFDFDFTQSFISDAWNL